MKKLEEHSKDKVIQIQLFDKKQVIHPNRKKNMQKFQTVLIELNNDQNRQIDQLRLSKYTHKKGDIIYLLYDYSNQQGQNKIKPISNETTSQNKLNQTQKFPQITNKTYSMNKLSPSKRIQSQIKFKSNNKWVKQNAILNHNILMIFSRHFPVINISKIKLYKLKENQDSGLIKFTCGKDVFFKVPLKLCQNFLPLYFLWFFKIIQLKIVNNTEMKKQPTIKQYFENENPQYQNTYIEGIIYKKSQVLGQWKERYVRINKSGIHSFIPQKNIDNETFTILKSDIKQIWCRFEKYENEFLILKVLHKSKTQFGIPIKELYSNNFNTSWLLRFYNLLAKN